MVVILRPGTTEEQITKVAERIKQYGTEEHPIQVRQIEGEERTVLNIIGDERRIDFDALSGLPGVERAVRILAPYKLASREFHPEKTVITVNGLKIGEEFVVMAGPCAVESEEQLLRIAREVKAAGANMLRGGAYKPRTSPYSFQGLRQIGLQYLATAKAETGLPIITEVLDTRDVDLVAKYSDVLQIGMRNMRNFELLKEASKPRKPVMLKRGDSSSINDWLLAAEYILSEGNPYVILCERGIVGFDLGLGSGQYRNVFDIMAIPMVKSLSHLPVFGDPSHSTGKRESVPYAAMAAVAAGADGLLVEAHYDPDKALSDGRQSITPATLRQLNGMARELYVNLRANGNFNYSK